MYILFSTIKIFKPKFVIKKFNFQNELNAFFLNFCSFCGNFRDREIEPQKLFLEFS